MVFINNYPISDERWLNTNGRRRRTTSDGIRSGRWLDTRETVRRAQWLGRGICTNELHRKYIICITKCLNLDRAGMRGRGVSTVLHK